LTFCDLFWGPRVLFIGNAIICNFGGGGTPKKLGVGVWYQLFGKFMTPLWGVKKLVPPLAGPINRYPRLWVMGSPHEACGAKNPPVTRWPRRPSAGLFGAIAQHKTIFSSHTSYPFILNMNWLSRIYRSRRIQRLKISSSTG